MVAQKARYRLSHDFPAPMTQLLSILYYVSLLVVYVCAHGRTYGSQKTALGRETPYLLIWPVASPFTS